jgi:hypothetical protein
MLIRVAAALLGLGLTTAPGRADSKPKVIVADEQGGRLVASGKIGLADGLFLSVAFVVVDPAVPEARKLGGLAGIVFVENATGVKDYRLSKQTRVTLSVGDKEFSLRNPKVQDGGAGVTALDFADFSAPDLYDFLRRDGRLGVTVDGAKFELTDAWAGHLGDLLAAVRRERDRIGK